MCPPENVRNICILAHVDHGKTTCADNLVASNGIISRQSAGKIRYMDSRTDEQERQITMKSSAIGLKYVSQAQEAHLINLIDSPGHVDFTSEVSTAARLADGALVVVDVVEGVAAQTRTVLRQAWRDRVKTCLFLNKIDRMIIELELTPMEAYLRLVRILEQVNAVNQQLISEEIMARDGEEGPEEATKGSGEAGIDLTSDNMLEFDIELEEEWRYSPEKGNVAFGSASHGWAFRIDTFAKMIGTKLGAKPQNLQRVLWGDWAFNPKTKLVSRRLASDTKTKPMAVQFMLDQIWRAYDITYTNLDAVQLGKMQGSIPAWEGLNFDKVTAGPNLTRDLFSKWMPFADAVLQMASEHLPSPIEAAPTRLPVLCPRWFAGAGALSAEGAAHEAVAQCLRRSDPEGTVVVYLAKFLGADLDHLVLTGDTLSGDADVTFVAMCRVFSGTLRPGQTLFVTQDEASGDKPPRTLQVRRIFRLMGRQLQVMADGQSGSMVAIELVQVNADGQANASVELGVERCLTLCSEADGPVFETPYSSQAFSIVRVSIEPKHVTDLDALFRGLRLLHRADPSVAIETMVTGENVLGCCGDEHLKRCITDLQKLYARDIPLQISTPLVAVRESVAPFISSERAEVALKSGALWFPMFASHLLDASTEASSTGACPLSEHDDVSDTAEPQQRISMSSNGIMSVWTANRKACIKVSCVALPVPVLDWMEDHVEELESVVHRHRSSLAFAGGKEATLGFCLHEIERQVKEKLSPVDEDDDGNENGNTAALAALAAMTVCGMSVTKGSRTLLFDATESGWPLAESYQLSSAAPDAGSELVHGTGAQGAMPVWMRPSVLAGFQLASNAGPLCEEPMRGVAFILHGCQVSSGVEESAAGNEGYLGAQPAVPTTEAAYGPMSGQVMSSMKEACRYCLYRRGFSRICEAMLSLEVECEQDVMGKVYGVLGQRRVRVLDEGLKDGTSAFHISCFLPLADSFGLAHDLRQAASGHVALHCAFSHWEQSEQDPFAEATLTPEEVEELGDQPLISNNARKLIDAIRKRKGLPTDEKVVSVATKQRTVTRKK